MLDFTASLYLGFRHARGSLRPWAQLTTGAPAALVALPGAARVAEQLAQLQGCEQTTLAKSTLHLAWDLFGMLAGKRVAIYLDSGAYVTLRWGVERAAARGMPVSCFRHNDPQSLQRVLAQAAHAHLPPIVVADGLCTRCGCHMPLGAYLAIVRKRGGLLILDDTQALGLLGQAPSPQAPYGRGGGGSLRRSGETSANVLVISSLAKGFGVPMAALSGSRALIRYFEAQSQTRVHCSPPSVAEIHAAEHALQINQEQGDRLRLQLAQSVCTFRQRLGVAGFSATGGLFPVQTLKLPPEVDTRALHEQLLSQGVRTVLRQDARGKAHISFILTARHRRDEIEHAVNVLMKAAQRSAEGAGQL